MTSLTNLNTQDFTITPNSEGTEVHIQGTYNGVNISQQISIQGASVILFSPSNYSFYTIDIQPNDVRSTDDMTMGVFING